MINDLAGEVWKPLAETNNRYFISNRGRFKHYKNGLCNLKETKTGLLYLKVCINKKYISFSQYRTMYKYFVSDDLSDEYVVLLKEHSELKPENLYLVNRKQTNKIFFGKRVYVYDTDMTLLSICNSCSEAAETYNIHNRSSVARVCNNMVSHANNYIFSYTELSSEELVEKINNLIMSYFNQCHTSNDSETSFEYLDNGIINKIYLTRKITYKSKEDETQTICFNSADWLQHVSTGKYSCARAIGELKPIYRPPSDQSELKTLIVYVYDGRNAKFLFRDTIYNVSIKFNCSCETIRSSVKNIDLSYTFINKQPYVISSCKNDSLIREFVRNNVPSQYYFKDRAIQKRYYAILSRCYCKTSSPYNYYGGKGITMFDDWKLDGREFEYFLSTNGFNKTLEIDRINPDFGYEPWNIQFISSKDNKVKMMSDKKRSPQQIEEDRIKYFQRKADFFKNYKKGKFIEEN